MKGRTGFFALLLVLGLCLSLSACTPAYESVSFFAMDCYMTIQAKGANALFALAECKDYILSLEDKLSATNAQSELSLLNASGQLPLSDESASLLSQALSLSKECEGYFDITVRPAVEAWGFPAQDFRIPSAEELSLLRSAIGYEKIEHTGNIFTLGQGQKVDLGAIAKGYASCKVSAMLRNAGIDSALVVLGGSVEAIGEKDGNTPWRIGVQHPDGGDNYLGICHLTDACMVTSGDYQRYFEQDGKRYCHIIDPFTACPAQSDLRSCTVICTDACRGDALSTALFVMGREKALDYWQKAGDFELILYTKEAQLYITEGLRSRFQSDLPVEVVSRGQ